MKAKFLSDLKILTKYHEFRLYFLHEFFILHSFKTEFILIGSKSMIKNISNSHPNVFIENKQIKQVYECNTSLLSVYKFIVLER